MQIPQLPPRKADSGSLAPGLLICISICTPGDPEALVPEKDPADALRKPLSELPGGGGPNARLVLAVQHGQGQMG